MSYDLIKGNRRRSIGFNQARRFDQTHANSAWTSIKNIQLYFQIKVLN